MRIEEAPSPHSVLLTRDVEPAEEDMRATDAEAERTRAIGNERGRSQPLSHQRTPAEAGAESTSVGG